MAKIVKITRPLILSLQDLQDEIFLLLKKRFPVLRDKLLRKIAFNAVNEFIQKGNNKIVEYVLNENEEEILSKKVRNKCLPVHGK